MALRLVTSISPRVQGRETQIALKTKLTVRLHPREFFQNPVFPKSQSRSETETSGKPRLDFQPFWAGVRLLILLQTNGWITGPYRLSMDAATPAFYAITTRAAQGKTAREQVVTLE